VTGGAGFIGSHVTELFLAKDWMVDVIDDLSSGKREQVPTGVSFHELDVRSAETARLVRETSFDAIVHLAAQMDVRRSVADPVFDAGVNILGALNVLEAVRARESAAGASHTTPTRVVFSSTGGVIYGDLATPPNTEGTAKDPDSPYAIAKLSVEYYLSYYARVHGLDTVSLRLGNVYGPRQDPHGEAGVVAIFCGRILDGQPLTIFGDGEQTRDYVHVADVADAIFRTITVPLPAPSRLDGRSFNIGTGVGASVLELSATLLAAAGATNPVQFAPKRPGEQQHSYLSVDKARQWLGWSPRTTLADGLASTFSWFAARAAPASSRS
jgi:UDP-glucose 4-epimerase